MKQHPIVLLMISFVFLTTAFAPSAKAQKFSSDEGKMSIKFPAEYETTDNGFTKKFTTTVGKQTFFVAYTLHEVALDDKEALAEVSLEAFNETLGGSIIDKSDWNVKKNEGLKAIISMEEQGGKIQYHVVLAGNIQYQVVIIAPNEEWDQKAADKFVKSFKIKK